MKQHFTLQKTLKHTFQLNHKMLNSLDFLKLENAKMHNVISTLLQQNPFLEYQNTITNDAYQYLENIPNKPSLKEELHLQLCSIQAPYNSRITDYIIESLDSRGFLSDDENTYLQVLKIDQKTFLKHLQIIQSLEPLGVAAKNSIDAICLQLLNKNYLDAYTMMKNYQDIILLQDFHVISKTCHLSKHQISIIFKQIKECNPFPCSAFDTNKADYSIPDITITLENKEVVITPINQPAIAVNEALFAEVKENQQMKDYFKEAHYLIENLTKRNQTVLIIANELVNIQERYFKYGDELSPCTLHDLANKCGFHESTISRTINQKYYAFNQDVFPLKQLLVSKSLSGDSSDAIKKALLIIIANEDKRHPFCDEELQLKLKEIDLLCSRRVIVKYRSQLNIPASFKRKRSAI